MLSSTKPTYTKKIGNICAGVRTGEDGSPIEVDGVLITTDNPNTISVAGEVSISSECKQELAELIGGKLLHPLGETCYLTDIDVSSPYTREVVISNLSVERGPVFNQAGSNNMPWNNGPVFLMNGGDGDPVYDSYELVSLKVFGDVASVTTQPTQVRSNSATMTGSLVNPVVVGTDQLIEFNFDAGQIYTNLGTNGAGSLPMRLDPTLGTGQMGYTTRPIPVGNQMTFGGGTAGQEIYGELTILVQERQTVRVISFVNKETGEICHYQQDSTGVWSQLAVIADEWDICPASDTAISREISIGLECKQELAEAIAEENAKCVTAQFSEKQLTNLNSLVDLFNFAPNADDTIDNAVVTIADIEAFFDNFDYDATPAATSTQGNFSIADFVGGAGTESNASFIEGYINVTGPMFIRMQNTNNWSGRVDLGENCSEYEDILTHYNGPGQSATSPAAAIPLGMHSLRVSSWDYDGANGNVNVQFSVTGTNGWTTDAASIPGLEFGNVPPTERTFLGRVCEGSQDVIEVSTGLVVPAAELASNETASIGPIAVGPIFVNHFAYHIADPNDPTKKLKAFKMYRSDGTLGERILLTDIDPDAVEPTQVFNLAGESQGFLT